MAKRKLPAEQPRRDRKSIALGAALFAITIIAYIPAMAGGFIWDDDAYVEHNPTLRSFTGLWQVWTHLTATPQYYPLVHSTFWLEAHLWGVDSPIGFHIVNVFIHAATAILLWRLLKSLQIPGSYLAALIWAIHPINVESVAWITERKNVLSGLFYILSFRLYLAACGFADQTPWSAKPQAATHRKKYIISILLFAAALFSKTVTASLPATILLILYYKNGKLKLRDIVPLIPFFILGAGMGILTGYLERTHVGAHGPEWSFTFTDRILIATRALAFYTGKICYPYPLSFIYPRWSINPEKLWQWSFLAAELMTLTALFAMRKKIGRGPLVAFLFFAGTLFPALGFANVYPMRYSFVADHFQYLAGIGLIVLFAVAVSRYKFIGFIVVPTLATLTFIRGFAYTDREALWTDTIKKNPNSWMAHLNLGHALHEKGDESAAAVEYQTALQLAPNITEPYLSVAMSDSIAGHFNAALAHTRQAIAIDPRYAPAYAILANLYLAQDNPTEAEKIAAQSLTIKNDYGQGHYIHARALEQLNRLPEAQSEYERAITLNPDDAPAHFHLADVLVHLRQLPEAAAHYQTSLGIDPNNAPAWTTLGTLKLAASQRAEAIECFKRALQIDPNLAPAKAGLQRAVGMAY